MPLTTADQLRFKLGDPLALRDTTMYGDGTANTFLLPYRNVQSGSAFVPLNGTAWSATGAAFNPSGVVAFSGVISAQSAFRVTYVDSWFSDEQITAFLNDHGSLNQATLAGIRELIIDASKRARWMSPDLTQFDDTQSIPALYRAYSALMEEEQLQGAATVGFESWADNQGLY